jgi:hypothetical protein
MDLGFCLFVVLHVCISDLLNMLLVVVVIDLGYCLVTGTSAGTGIYLEP